MLFNYILITLRNFGRNKIFSLINILGLAIGICASLVIYMIVQYEYSFENFRGDKDRIYRVVHESVFQGNTAHFSGVPMPLPEAVRLEEYALESATHCVMLDQVKVTVPHPDIHFKKQQKVVCTDAYYFNLFPATWLAGSFFTSQLDQPNMVVISQSRADLYFNGLHPSQVLGRQLIYEDSVLVTVTGVIADDPGPTDLLFKEFISLKTIAALRGKNQYGGNEWSSISTDSQFFVKLAKNSSVSNAERRMSEIVRKHNPPKEESEKTSLRLQNISDIHFSTQYDQLYETGAHLPTLLGLMAVAGFLLVLACINFINLTTAQAVHRSKEIGVRKTLGGTRIQLATQFLAETFILTLIATLVAVTGVPFLLRVFKDFIRPEITGNFMLQSDVIVFLICLIVVVSFFAGLYPAILLSRFRPVAVLKNHGRANSSDSRRSWLRKGLTVSQFVIAQFFIIATLIVAKQITYSLDRDLGYDKDGIIFFSTHSGRVPPGGENKREVLLSKLRTIPEVHRASIAGYSPASMNSTQLNLTYEDSAGKKEKIVELKFADTSYFRIYNLRLLAGEFLRQDGSGQEYLINDTYRRELGFARPEDALGKMIGGVPIGGVLADFITRSTHSEINPVAYLSALHGRTMFHVQLNKDSKKWESGIKKIELAFRTLYPEYEFNYKFFDESVASFYIKDQQTKSLLSWATGLCIFISCLGLWGLAIYTTNQRTKEIGIRKVFGASVRQIVLLLSKDFIALVLLATIIAWPFAWLAVKSWLDNFAYRVDINAWTFISGGLFLIIIAMAILSARIFRVSIANPTKSLRTE